ncbi:MAG: DUF192 domain-containing protein [Acidobacteriaceae bacterium]
MLKQGKTHRKQVLKITNRTRSMALGEQIELADTELSRLFGLLGRRNLAPQQGLLIVPSNGVHTLCMRFPIDVLLLDKQGKVLAIYENLRPFRITRLIWKAWSALELPAGTISRTQTRIGDEVFLESA